MLCCFLLYNKEISHNYTYITSLLSLCPSSHPTPLGHHRAPIWAPCVIQQFLTSSLVYTWQCINVDATCSTLPTLSFPHCVHKSVLYLCVSIPFPANSFINILCLLLKNGCPLSLPSSPPHEGFLIQQKNKIIQTFTPQQRSMHTSALSKKFCLCFLMI